MNKQEIINALYYSHQSFIEYLTGLSTDQYTFRNGAKWSAGQQLEHIILCVTPLVKVFGMDHSAIEQNFRMATLPSLSYDALVAKYIEKLQQGGKAPERYEPEEQAALSGRELSETLVQLVATLCRRVEQFTEQQLDTFLIPHPLLGNLTFREMLYNAIYHVGHHAKMTKKNLEIE